MFPSSPPFFSHTAALGDAPRPDISPDLLDFSPPRPPQTRSSQTPPTQAYLLFLSLSHASSITPLSSSPLSGTPHQQRTSVVSLEYGWTVHLRHSTVRDVKCPKNLQFKVFWHYLGAHGQRRSLNVLIVRLQGLSVNTLPVSLLSVSECSVSQKYESWLRVRQKGEKKPPEATQRLHIDRASAAERADCDPLLTHAAAQRAVLSRAR